MNARKLCPEHAEEWGRWLDYRPPAAIRLVQIGSANPDRMREQRRISYERWRDTIRTQQELVRQACAEQCQDWHEPQPLRLGLVRVTRNE